MQSPVIKEQLQILMEEQQNDQRCHVLFDKIIKSFIKRVTSFAGPISTSLRPGNTVPFEEMSQWWRAVGNTGSDLTGSRFEHRTSHFKDKSVTARPTGRLHDIVLYVYQYTLVQRCSPPGRPWPQRSSPWPWPRSLKSSKIVLPSARGQHFLLKR